MSSAPTSADGSDSFADKLQLTYHFMSWWGAIILTVLASAFSYYSMCKYGDLLHIANLKQQQNDERERSDSASTSTPESPRASSSLSTSSRVKAMKVITMKTTSVTLFVIAFITFAVLDFVALQILPLTMVIPITMLVFVWGTLYRVIFMGKRMRFIVSRDFVTAVVIVFLIGFSICFSPKETEAISVPSLVVWDTKTIIYTAIFLIVAILLHVLRWKQEIALRMFKPSGLSSRNVNTVIRGCLTGILGGQALVLMKLVAEIVENAVFHDTRVFNGTATFVVVALSLVCTCLHIYSFHYMLAVLDEENARLLLPVHRFFMIVSASVGASVYLEEWVGVGVVFIVGYSFSLTALLCVCIVYAYHAVRVFNSDDEVSVRPNTNDAAASSSEVSPQMSFQTVNSSPDDDSTIDPNISTASSSSMTSLKVPIGLWDLGLVSVSKDRNDDEDDDGFFMSSNRTMFTSPFGRRKSSSTPDKEMIKLKKKSTNDSLNYVYPPARNTMMVKQGAGNPHTDGDNFKSTWVDPGDLPKQWKVRGSKYLQDKVKIDAERTRMQVATMQWTYAPKPVMCISREEDGYIQTNQEKQPLRPFVFVINFAIPSLGNYVTYFVHKPELKDPVFNRMLNDFVNAKDDQYRHDRFKLIPGVKEGGYFVKSAVGAKPALLCNKLTTTYFSSWNREEKTIDVCSGGGEWFEVSIDVGSSRVARSIMGAVKGYASSLVLHLGYLLESKNKNELPERMLGGIDLYRPAMAPKKGVPLLLPADIPDVPTIDSLPEQSVLNEMVENEAILAFTEPESYDTDGGYDTDGSFRSFMDVEDEEDTFEIVVKDETKDAHVEVKKLDYTYPIPADTMVMPKGVFNPHAEPGRSFWVDAGDEEAGWKVRGPLYDVDRVKIPCGEARMKVGAFEWLYYPTKPLFHIATRPNGFIETYHHNQPVAKPHLLIINFLVPSVGNYVTYLYRKPDIEDPVFDEMLESFINAEDDAYRNARLKLIPGMLEGNYWARKAVGSKPALLCQKLTTTYYRGDNYFEVDIDVGSSIIGARIFGAVKGFASGLILHLGVVLESKTRRELPERLLYGVNIHTPVMAPKKPKGAVNVT